MDQRLWAPWRVQYIEELGSDGCVFCEAISGSAAHIRTHRVLAERESEFAILNKYPYGFGHVLVCPRRHVSQLNELSPQEQSSLFQLVCDSQQAMSEAVSPHGFNLGMNIGKNAGAGIEDHIHMHIVPRWQGDTNFMPVTADCAVMPAHLDTVYQMLEPAFSALDGND
jgi:ATP adenylyltransferase